MTQNEPLQNIDQTKHVTLRLATPSDAEFILKLRLNKTKNKYLSSVENDLEGQRKWLIKYKEREQKDEEFYYIIQGDNHQDLGAVRIYDIQNDSFCWGSWILSDKAPSYAAIESALLIYEIGFYQLGFKKSHFDVRKKNTKVFNFHKKFGAVVTHEDDDNFYLEIDKASYEKTKMRYHKFFITA